MSATLYMLNKEKWKEASTSSFSSVSGRDIPFLLYQDEIFLFFCIRTIYSFSSVSGRDIPFLLYQDEIFLFFCIRTRYSFSSVSGWDIINRTSVLVRLNTSFIAIINSDFL
jgi:hypothetical protein